MGETELREEAMGRLVGETAYGYENRAAWIWYIYSLSKKFQAPLFWDIPISSLNPTLSSW